MTPEESDALNERLALLLGWTKHDGLPPDQDKSADPACDASTWWRAPNAIHWNCGRCRGDVVPPRYHSDAEELLGLIEQYVQVLDNRNGDGWWALTRSGGRRSEFLHDAVRLAVLAHLTGKEQ
jgi:hypothetical protein